MHMLKRQLLIGVAASLLVASGSAAGAQEVLKLGLVLSMTGAFNTAGKAVVNGALLYLKQHGDTVAGRKVQVIEFL
jgi:branched-chain amino acid transport system substrate-binding protein